MAAALDHVFVFVPAEAAEAGGAVAAALRDLGLVPSYRRRHAGQGTANVCYVFDNAVLELLFAVDPAELAASPLARSGFPARADWRRSGASPFGIAVRGGAPDGPVWSYRLEGFPPGVAIPIAAEGDDPAAPFVFGSPGSTPPTQWTDGRDGERQTAAGFTTLEAAVALPPGASPGPALAGLIAAGVVDVLPPERDPRMVLTLHRAAGRPAVRLDLPAFAVLPD